MKSVKKQITTGFLYVYQKKPIAQRIIKFSKKQYWYTYGNSVKKILISIKFGKQLRGNILIILLTTYLLFQ